jgi:hypothetical protein
MGLIWEKLVETKLVTSLVDGYVPVNVNVC